MADLNPVKSLVDLAADCEDFPDPKFDTILPVTGWWVLRRVKRDPDRGVTLRDRVAAWGSYTDPTLGAVVVPLIADGVFLRPPSAIGWISPTTELDLWHDGDTHCTCRSEPFDASAVDDIWWCPDCAGVIG